MSSPGITSHISQNGLAYLSCGPADSESGLVCVHGWGCQASDYDTTLEQVSRRAPDLRAIAIDLPGHGKTPTEVCPIATISTFAQMTLALMDELKLRTVILVGHSMGCRVVLDTWEQAQKSGKPTVKGVVFLDGSHYKLRPTLFAFDSKDARSKGMTDEEKAAKKAEAFQKMFSERTPATFQRSTLAHIKAIDKNYSNAIRESHLLYDYTEMDDALARIGVSRTPLLNIQSTDVDAKNQRIPLKAGETSKWMDFIKAKVPHAQQVVIEDSAHFPHVDCPAVVAEKLLLFVQEQGVASVPVG